MANKLLIVGLATDGPSNICFTPRNMRELITLFGGEYRERFYLSPTASTLSLQYNAFKLPINEVDSKKQYLFAPALDQTYSNILYFGTLGGSSTHTVDIVYAPYLGQKDLITAAKRFFDITGQIPSVLRLGGAAATLSVSGWVFESKYAGYRYNNLGLYSNGTNFVQVFGLEPNYQTNSYTYSSVEKLTGDIERNYHLGISPIVCTSAGTGMIPSGTYWFSGGSDGTFSDSDFTNMLDIESPPISCTHILVLSEITSSMVEGVYTYHASSQQPRMFIIPSVSYEVTGTADEYITQLNTQLPYRHDMISAVVGNITTNYEGEILTRYAAEAAAIAFSRSGYYNFTNLPVVASTFTPVLNESDLNTLKSNGFVSLMRYIGNNIAVYQGVNLYNEHSFLYSSKVAEISSIVYEYCFQFYGLTMGDGPKPDMAATMTGLLSTVQFLEIQSVDVFKETETLHVKVNALLPDEILEISFAIENR